MLMKHYAVKLVAINIVVFILQFVFPLITENFALVSSEVLIKPWTLITYMFFHSTKYFPHLLYNMLALILFGSILEEMIGGERFLKLYFASGIIAGLGSILFYEASIGASGAIFGIIGTLVVLRPRMKVFIGYTAIPLSLAVFLWGLSSFVGLFASQPVAYAAHLFGLCFGLLYGFTLKKKFGETHKRSFIDKEFRKWKKSVSI